MKKLLFKPVIALMENRTKEISNSLEEANNAKEEAQKIRQEYDGKLDNAAVEAHKIIEDARNRGTQAYEEMVEKAKNDAASILERAQKDIENERAQMITKLKSEIAGLAMAAASKVIEKNLDNETNRQIIDQFINEEGAA
jgi:F-type H+-transporting ATPase subunit b